MIEERRIIACDICKKKLEDEDVELTRSADPDTKEDNRWHSGVQAMDHRDDAHICKQCFNTLGRFYAEENDLVEKGKRK